MSSLRQSLRASVFDGAGNAAMLGFGELYFPAFALLLGATSFEVGLLTTVPMLTGAVAQLLAPRLARQFGNKRLVVVGALAQAAVFVPIAALSAAEPGAYLRLLGWVSLYWALALGITPAWNAWMGRMIPARVRSRFFGRRNSAINAVLLASILAGGFLIHAAERSAWGPASGFVAVFACALLSRLFSAWYLTRQHEPAVAAHVARPHLLALLRGMRRRPYGRLIGLLVLVTGSVHVSAAYFTPFMLRELGLSYAEFTVLNAAVLLSRIVSSAYWGEIARSFGNRRALQVAGTLLVPLAGLWTISDHFAYLLALQLLAGFAWAGFELTTVLNFFDYTDDANRAAVLSLYNLLNGVAIVIGSLLGGAVLLALGSQGYAVIFLASSTLRALTLLLLARGVGERRGGEHSFQHVFTRVVTLRPGQGPGLRPVVLDEPRVRRRRH